MALRMTFGGSPCPSIWGYISDTCNTLIHNIFWDHNILFDNLSLSLDLSLSLPDEIKFHEAKPLSVSLPTNDIGKVDVYIDDSIDIALDIGDNVRRIRRAIPLTIHAFSRSVNSSDPIPSFP
jgi:hypothetical protein